MGVLVGLGAGCNAISGIDSFSIVRPIVEAGAPSDAIAPVDAPPDVLEPLPTCGDGRVCAAAPSGWTIVLARSLGDAGLGAGCAEGYTNAETVVEKPPVVTPAVCECTCGSGQGSCSGPIAFTVGVGACTLSAANVRPDGTCVQFSGGVSGTATGRAVPPAPVEQACPGNPRTAQLPPAQAVTTQICRAVATTDGCSDSRVCVGAPEGSDVLCVTSTDGAAECPAEFPNRRAIGDGLDDKRACGPCACETRSQCGATLSVSTSSSCSSGNFTFTADGMCRTINSGSSSDYVAASGTTTVRSDPCVVKTPSMPTGDVDVAHPRALCCRSAGP